MSKGNSAKENCEYYKKMKSAEENKLRERLERLFKNENSKKGKEQQKTKNAANMNGTPRKSAANTAKQQKPNFMATNGMEKQKSKGGMQAKAPPNPKQTVAGKENHKKSSTTATALNGAVDGKPATGGANKGQQAHDEKSKTANGEKHKITTSRKKEKSPQKTMLQKYESGESTDDSFDPDMEELLLDDSDSTGSSEELLTEEDEEGDYFDFDEEEDYDSDFDEDEEEDDSSEYADDTDEVYSYGGSADESDVFDHASIFERARRHEDMIIHRGTATMRSLKPEDNVEFDSDDGEPQIKELSEQTTIKIIKQHKEYHVDELEKLNTLYISEERKEQISTSKESAPQPTEEVKKLLVKKTKEVERKLKQHEPKDSTDCPKLMPIVDEDGFQLYNSEMDDESESELEVTDDETDGDSFESTYEECLDSDDDSIISLDISSKYRKHQLYDTTDSDDELAIPRKKIKVKADLVCVENLTYEEEPKSGDNEGVDSDKTQEDMDMCCDDSGLLEAKVVESESQEEEELASASPATENDYTIESNVTSDATNDAIQPADDIPQTSSTPPKPFRSIFCNAIDSNHVLVLLRDTFYVYGTLKLTLLVGQCEIYGHKPQTGKDLELFSPRGCSTVQISPSPSMLTTRAQLDKELQALETYFLRADLERIKNRFEPQTDALLLLKRNDQRKKLVNLFKKYMSENVFPNMTTLRSDNALYASEFMLNCFINQDSEKALKLAPPWAQLPLQPHTKLMLVGGKSVGKSTLLRYLVNRHLSTQPRILVVDLDIGQSELFVPQTIYCAVVTQPLLGPGFFLNLQPDKAFLIGHTHIVLCAHAYMRAVRQLLAYCHAQPEYAQIPWLINTMGYNKGFGMELVAVLREFVRPTDIVQIQSNKEINNFDAPLEAQTLEQLPRNIFVSDEFKADSPLPAYRLHVLNSALMQQSRFQQVWHMAPKDLRYAMILARLSDALQGSAEWLTDCKPLCAPLDCLKVISMLTPDSTREELLQATEANLVFLCQQAGDRNVPIECFGIGIVRGIDYHIQQIYLLPAMPHSQMSSVNCLALSEMPLPTSMLTNQGPKVRNVAPFVYNTIDAKASKAIKQIYHRPAEFLTGKHKKVL